MKEKLIHIVKCSKCGSTLGVPNLMQQNTREKILSPYCCAFTLFCVQWLIHHGWHVRNLGLTDCHPYLCPDCWEEGTPEYEKQDYGEEWCKQAQVWLDSATEKK